MFKQDFIERRTRFLFVGADFVAAANEAASRSLSLNEWEFIFSQDAVMPMRVFVLED